MASKPTFSEFADPEHQGQAEAFLLELGRFCVAFERVCEAMRYAILWIFKSEGLTHPTLAQVVIGDTGSAELQVLLGALFSELRARYGEADQRAVQAVLKQVKSLTEERNLVVHSAWRFGNNSAIAEMMAGTVRPRTKQKQGAVPELHGLSTSHLRKLTHRAAELQVMLQRLQNCILSKSLSVAEQLAKAP